MKPNSDRADEIGKIIRTAGFEIPAPGIKERIMNRIEWVSIKKSFNVKPVIGLRGWILIGTSGIILLILSYFLIDNIGTHTTNSLIDSNPILQSIWHPDKMFWLNLRIPKALLFALTGLLIWIGMDFLLNTLIWKKHPAKGIS
ncbi:MAG: hypothetical protein JW973_16490 [Bacteroidales bacterium]|nr:hypothetical protein [Bacteroidales bacterium]